MNTLPPTPTASKWQTFRRFVHNAWALTRPYFHSDERWKARALLAAIVVLNLAMVYMAVLFNDWNRLFYDALQNKDAAVFWEQLGRFCMLAAVFIVLAVYKFYLTQLLEIRWRAWMTAHYLDRWLGNQAFYHLELTRFAAPSAAPNAPAKAPDNPDQRIQEDIAQFTSQTVGLSMGLLNAVVTLASFVGILWSLSGGFAFTVGGEEYAIPGFMVWMAVAYAAAGSVITHYVGRPQIRLNFEQQRLEAEFRHHMVRVREYSEAIALDGGASVERRQLGERFGAALGNSLRLIQAQKRLVWFTSFFGQAAVVFPFLVAAPRFFSGAIQLGELMQISSAFGRVQDSLSWFVDNYSTLAAWRATTDRLTGFEASFQAIAGIKQGADTIKNTAPDAAESLEAQGLTVALPDGTPWLGPLDLRLQPGQRVLLQGPSGSGKSTLLRALAGIWPFARGRVQTPRDAVFMPQRPYFPVGRLRTALAYPEAADTYADAPLCAALQRVGLAHLCPRLDEEAAWGQQLSGGEQQRLALARVLLKQPLWVFADEATSALDEAAEHALYQTLVDALTRRGGTLVSIAHKPSVAAFHDASWQLQPAAPDARHTESAPRWTLLAGTPGACNT